MDLLTMATVFTVLEKSDSSREEITVERRTGRDGVHRWAVCCGGNVLNKNDLCWDYESLPSNRSDEFIKNTRWDNLDVAMYAAVNEANQYKELGHFAYWDMKVGGHV